MGAVDRILEALDLAVAELLFGRSVPVSPDAPAGLLHPERVEWPRGQLGGVR